MDKVKLENPNKKIEKKKSPAELLKEKMNNKKDISTKKNVTKKAAKERVNFVLEKDLIDKIQTIADEEYEGNISLVYRKIIKSSDLLKQENN